MHDNRQFAASLVFLIIYSGLLIATIAATVSRRPRLRFITLGLFVLIRIGSMVAGIGLSLVGYSEAFVRWLIGFLVLGAEGYFVLVLCFLYSVAGYQLKFFHTSWLHPQRPKGLTLAEKIRHDYRSPSLYFHYGLVPGNVLVIIGGSKQASGTASADFSKDPKVIEGSHLRTAGQALFLFNTVVVIGIAVHTFINARRQRKPTGILYLILATAPFLLVRGSFGVLQSANTDWSYYNPNNYDAKGIKPRLLVGEYLMGTTMECIAAVLLFIAAVKLTYKKEEYNKEKEEEGAVEVEGNAPKSDG